MRFISVRLLMAVLVGAALGTATLFSDRDSPWNGPIARSWPAVNAWNERFEAEYSQFVEKIGQAVAQRRCGRLDACLRDPSINLLYDPPTDDRLSLNLDCGDLPYVLRAYYSFKRRLPFGFVCEVNGNGPDPRYMSDVTPVRFCSWKQYTTPHSALRGMVNEVHSGMYRMAPDIENSDFYPVAIHRGAVRPGTVYYDPNGHVLTVAEVRADGAVYLIDGHPDGSLTWKRFGQAFALGGKRQGGGFKNFRTLRLNGGEVSRVKNVELADFDDQSQWDKALWASIADGTNTARMGGYHRWVRAMLAEASVKADPVIDLRDQIRALCRDISERVESVDLAVAAKFPLRPHPGELPWNIYGAQGEWEIYATPSRDARLKAAFRELHEGVTALPTSSPLLPALKAAWLDETEQPACHFAYRNSHSEIVPFTLADVLDRLFLMSFDPYHCPELRWGAHLGSLEAATCVEDHSKQAIYDKEQRLRNRIDRDYASRTGFEDGPEAAPDIDVRFPLGLLPP